jgi:16S rRNA (cytidine1402-2'-O)-methyltransferase
VLPEETRRIAAGLSVFIVEQAKTARAFLKQLPTALPLQQLTLLELNEHTPARTSWKACLHPCWPARTWA